MQGWKQQEARRSVGGGRNWILRKRARHALLLSEFQERVLFFSFSFCKTRKLDHQNVGFPSKLFFKFQRNFSREPGPFGAAANSLDPVSGTLLPSVWHSTEVTGHPPNLHTPGPQASCT